MRMFTTYLIATLLFGLCLLENELRKGAHKSEINTKNYTKLSRITTETPTDQNFLIKSKFHYQGKLTPDNELDITPSAQFISADSSNVSDMPKTPTITVQ